MLQSRPDVISSERNDKAKKRRNEKKKQKKKRRKLDDWPMSPSKLRWMPRNARSRPTIGCWRLKNEK